MPEPNGKHIDNGDSLQPTNGIMDPLVEAEALKGLLTEAQTRLGRLIGALKQFRKQSRAVAAAVQSLRQLPPLTS